MTLGNGSVEQLPSGRWRARISTGGQLRGLGTYETEAEARAIAAEANRQLWERATAREAKPAGALTLAAWGAQWLDRREVSRKVRGIVQERSVWTLHIEGSELGSLPLEAITKRDVAAWLESMETKEAIRRTKRRGGALVRKGRGRRLSWKTINHALILLRLAVQAAVDDDLLDRNVVRDVPWKPMRASESEGWTFLTNDEVLRIASSDIPEPSRTIFIVAIFTGLRQGELWGLRWGDVQLEGEVGEVVVRRSHGGPTKSGKVRRVPLFEVPRRFLVSHRERAGNVGADDLVFPAARGGARRRGNDAGWADAQPKGGEPRKAGFRSILGVRRAVRFHDFRHTCASHLVMGTWGRAWSLSEVAAFLGHASIKTTEMYAHLSPDHLRRAAMQTATVEGETASTSTKPRGISRVHGRMTNARLNEGGSEGCGHVEADVEAWANLLKTLARGEPVPTELVEGLLDGAIGGEIAREAARLRFRGWTIADIIELAGRVVLSIVDR